MHLIKINIDSHWCDGIWPWKQSRYSSFCGVLDTWTMAMGKLCVVPVNTADASDTSFLSKNSAKKQAKHSLHDAQLEIISALSSRPDKWCTSRSQREICTEICKCEEMTERWCYSSLLNNWSIMCTALMIHHIFWKDLITFFFLQKNSEISSQRNVLTWHRTSFN